MRKRFVDAEMWQDIWFRELPPKVKCFWNYICASCDIAGFWKKDFGLASFAIGEKIEEKEIVQYFNNGKDRLIDNGSTYFIVQYPLFQYGKLGSSDLHQKVIGLLKEKDVLCLISKEGFVKGSLRVKAGIKNKNKNNTNNKNNKEVVEIFDFFNVTLNKKLKLSIERESLISKRLSEGRTVDELKKAILNFSKDDWADRYKHMDLIYAIGTRNKIDNLDKWLNMGVANKPLERIIG